MIVGRSLLVDHQINHHISLSLVRLLLDALEKTTTLHRYGAGMTVLPSLTKNLPRQNNDDSTIFLANVSVVSI